MSLEPRSKQLSQQFSVNNPIRRLFRFPQPPLSPLVDEFFAWLTAQAARVSRKSDLGKAMTYMLKRNDGFRLFLEDGRVDIDSNLVENAIRSPAMNRRNCLFAGHDEGGQKWARFASLIGSCKMNAVDPYLYLRDLLPASPTAIWPRTLTP